MTSDQPFLTTARFELWLPRKDDVDALCTLMADEETRRFLGAAKPTREEQFARLMRMAGGWMLHGYSNLFARRPGSREIIASCGIFPSIRGFGMGMDDVPEAGWTVRRDHWQQGVAREVMDAVLAWFDAAHGPQRIACMIEEGNTPSEALAARLGFIRYGSHVLEDPDPVTLNLFERLPG